MSSLLRCISIHGVLVDVFGEGVLIMGESGIGKSEAATGADQDEAIVSSADDVVEISRVSDISAGRNVHRISRVILSSFAVSVSSMPRRLFGVGERERIPRPSTWLSSLEEWDKEKEYDRLGPGRRSILSSLATSVVCHSLPIRPGRKPG